MSIDIHHTATISLMADIEESKRSSSFTVGAHWVIDSFVKVKPAGGSGDVIIGERVTINSGCVIYSGNCLTIGNDVAIVANCVFAPVNHAVEKRDQLIIE